MKVFRLPFTQLNTKTSVALGFFDGVHAGHRAVISKAVEYAQKNGLQSVVWTFDTSPKSAPVITSAQEREGLLEEIGVDILISFPFSEEVKKTECAEFVEAVIKKCLGAQKVFCGFNYSFGAGGKGDPETLKRLCAEHGIQTEILPPVERDGSAVSSSRIRELIEKGDMTKTAALLGRPYSLCGTVTHGKKLGRTIGFPTVNCAIEKGKVVPADGVYLTRVVFDGKVFYGITDIGVKPTVGEHARGAETNILDFEGDLYGKDIKTEFLEYLRSEKKFDSVEQLTEQLKSDREKAKELLEKYEN